MLAVITYQNMPRMKAPPIVDFHNIGKGFALSDLPIMQDAEMHWDGEPVAVVVAETLEQAEHAASLVEVEYEAETPAVSFEARKPKRWCPTTSWANRRKSRSATRRRPSRRRRRASTTSTATPRYNHNAIEPHATIAVWNDDGSLAVFDSTQSVNLTAHTLAYRIRSQDWKMSRWSRRLSAAVSAAKSAVEQHAALRGGGESGESSGEAGVVARRTFSAWSAAAPSRNSASLWARGNDGKLTALIHTGLTATTSSGRYAEQCTFPPRHLYASPNLFIGQKIVYLDTVANTWMRAPGESIGTFALESAIDELAHELRMDPIELRRINEPRKGSDERHRVLQPAI